MKEDKIRRKYKRKNVDYGKRRQYEQCGTREKMQQEEHGTNDITQDMLQKTK